MQEYVSEAIVLAREPKGDADLRFSLFTRRYGKFFAKAKSARKITSKLGPHLSEGNVAHVRIVEKGGFQLVDALKIGKLPHALKDLERLNMLLPEVEPDQRLWRALLSERFDWNAILQLLGWDPKEAACILCGRAPSLFRIVSQEFLCRPCALKRGNDAVSLI